MIKLLPIDYCGTIEELSKWHDEWSCEVFGSIDPSRYYKQAGEGGRYLYGAVEDMSLNEEKATRERVLELLLRIRSINQKLSGKGISQRLRYEECKQMKMKRKTLYDEYLKIVQPEPEPVRGKTESIMDYESEYLIREMVHYMEEHLLVVNKEVLTSNEAASYMGVSKSYLYKMTMERQIPHYKPMGKMMYFNRQELEQWLLRNRVSTQEELEEKAQAYCLNHKLNTKKQ